MNRVHVSFRQLFATLFLLFVGLLAATALEAWTGPNQAPPSGNVPAPINVGTIDQVKNAGLSLNSLAVFGSQYVQKKLGVGVVSPVVSIETPGTIKIGNGGEVCQAVTEGGVRYNSTSKVVEFCNGTAWVSLAVTTTTTVTPGSQTYATPGSYVFNIPNYNTLSVTVLGAGGGGAAGGCQLASGSDGGSSSFNSAVMGGGGGGAPSDQFCNGLVGPSGSQGGASGGDTNTVGGGASGGAGGRSPFGYSGGAGGAGGKATKTYAKGQLSGAILVTVGAGGAGGNPDGSPGGSGSVSITWQ